MREPITKLAVKKHVAYKDSGAEWSGLIPKHWDLQPIRAIFSERREKNDGPKTDFILSVTKDRGVIPYDEKGAIGNNKSEDIERYKVVYPNDLVLNKMNVIIGSLGLSKYFGALSQVYIVLQSKSNRININYYSYIFSDQSFYKSLIKYCTGIMDLRESLNLDDFKKLPLPIPSYEEQTRIVYFLKNKIDLIDKAISIEEKQIELLLKRKQIIIQNAVTQGLNSDVSLKDSGVKWIENIPNHWAVKKLKYILTSQGRIGFKGYTTSDLVDEGALTLGASQMDWDGNILLSNPVYISWRKYYESPEIMVSINDIVIVQRGSTCGKVALIREDLGPTTINPSLVLLKKILEIPEFVFFALKVVLPSILNLVSNTAIPMLSQFQIDNIVIPIPPRDEQLAIVKYITSQSIKIDASVSLLEKKIEKLKEYKITLINSAVTGKIKVN